MTAALFGGRGITIADVAAVSFLTKKGTDHVSTSPTGT